jgi:Flp pilus assembly protein TadG
MRPQSNCNPSKITRAARQRGSIMIMTAVLLPVVMGLTGMAIDVGRFYSVQRQLQNASSAAAMAGAASLYNSTGQSGAPPYFTGAQNAATAALANNTVMNSALSSAVTANAVQAGYFDSSTQKFAASSAVTTLTGTMAPAVQVSFSQANGNAVPVKTLFAGVVGIKSMPASAASVAGFSAASVDSTNPTGATCPSTAGISTVAPVAISKCMYDNYYWKDGEDDDDGDGIKDGPHPKRDPSTGQPYDFHIGPQQIYYPNGQCSQSNTYNHNHNSQCSTRDGHDQTYWYNTAYQCTSGGWTGFDTGHNDDASIKNFITNRNPNKLKDDTDGRPSSCKKSSSTTQSLYDAINRCSASGDKSCEYMMIPILDTSSTPSGSAASPITGFACVHIASADRTQGCVHTQMVAPGTKDSNGKVVCSPISTDTNTSTSSSTGKSTLCYGLKGGGGSLVTLQ